jgi:hypothetical protein
MTSSVLTSVELTEIPATEVWSTLNLTKLKYMFQRMSKKIEEKQMCELAMP